MNKHELMKHLIDKRINVRDFYTGEAVFINQILLSDDIGFHVGGTYISTLDCFNIDQIIVDKHVDVYVYQH